MANDTIYINYLDLRSRYAVIYKADIIERYTDPDGRKRIDIRYSERIWSWVFPGIEIADRVGREERRLRPELYHSSLERAVMSMKDNIHRNLEVEKEGLNSSLGDLAVIQNRISGSQKRVAFLSGIELNVQVDEG